MTCARPSNGNVVTNAIAITTAVHWMWLKWMVSTIRATNLCQCTNLQRYLWYELFVLSKLNSLNVQNRFYRSLCAQCMKKKMKPKYINTRVWNWIAAQFAYRLYLSVEVWSLSVILCSYFLRIDIDLGGDVCLLFLQFQCCGSYMIHHFKTQDQISSMLRRTMFDYT